MTDVRIGRDLDELVLSVNEDTETTGQIVATLSVGGLNATRRIDPNYAEGFDDLATFFAQLAADWRGWDGERVWRSIDRDLVIEARHSPSQVRLGITIRSHEEAWTASVEIGVDPGEQLSRAASQLGELASRIPR